MIKTFEQFNNNQDIDAICKEYNIKNSTIRPDGKVDVDGDVDLSDKDLTKLPLDFGIVNGYFDCSRNNLTTLEFAPEKVGGGFNCSYNNLTTLEFAPDYVGGGFSCYSNNILDVEALVKCRIGGKLFIKNNPISSIIEDIEDIEHFYLINPLRGNKLSKWRYDEVRDDLELPPFDYDYLHKDIELVD